MPLQSGKAFIPSLARLYATNPLAGHRYLLIDSRPRRVVLVLPSSLPVPLLSTTLDTIFNRFQSPTISLVSAPVMAAAAAGVRAALVVDLGWGRGGEKQGEVE